MLRCWLTGRVVALVFVAPLADTRLGKAETVIETKGIFDLLARLGPIKSPYPDYAARLDRVPVSLIAGAVGLKPMLQAFHWIPTCAGQSAPGSPHRRHRYLRD